MSIILHDLRLALRSLAKSPGFAVAALVTLSVGIGAAAAIVSVLDGVVLRPLPYPEPDRLVYVDSHVPADGEGADWGVTGAAYFHIGERNRVFEEVGAYGGAEMGHQFTVVGEQGGARVDAAYVTASLFRVLRAQPAVGRLISELDDRPGMPRVVVLGNAFWRREFGADPTIVGRRLELEGGLPVEIIGVLEPDLHLPHGPVDVWVPLGLDPGAAPDNFHGNRVIGRLLPGVTVADAAADLARLTAEFPEAMPEAYSAAFLQESGFTTRATALHKRVLRGLDRVIWLLAGSVGLVLLIACTNVANLFLLRAEAKRRDRAIRMALGTGRPRIAAHSVSEALLLTIGAAVTGIWLARGALRLMLAVAPPGLPRLDGIEIGGTAVAFALGVAVVAGVIFGGLPAVTAPTELTALRDGGRGMTVSKRGHRVRSALVVAQVALALVLLATAGLMVRSFQRLNAVQPGFDARGTIALEFFTPSMSARYRQPSQIQAFYRELTDRVAGIGGVESVGGGRWLPLGGDPFCNSLYVEGRPLRAGEQPPCVDLSEVIPGYFRSLGIPLRGDESDWLLAGQAPATAVVTRALAERLWPGEDPIGKGILSSHHQSRGLPPVRVVGVAGDIRGEGLDRPPSEAIFYPMEFGRSMNLIVRTSLVDPTHVIAAIRSTIHEMDPAIAIGQVRSMEEVIATSPSVAVMSLVLLLLGIGAGVGVLLGAIGLFGVVAYMVGQRRVEIGIRMALGARSREVAEMVGRQSMALALTGTAVGLASTLGSTRLLRSFLFDVHPADPSTLVAVTALLLIVAGVATYVPVRRATQVDPLVTLRAE